MRDGGQGRSVSSHFATALLTGAALLTVCQSSRAECGARPAAPAAAIHYAPAENLEHIDVELIDSARREIDFAAYVLTDWPIMQALTRAANRGVKVRIYLDATQFAEREPTRVFEKLAHAPSVEIRVKRESSAFMHLKSYAIDGQLLRTGAANFSASGLKRQDNDLVVIQSSATAAAIRDHLGQGPGSVALDELDLYDSETRRALLQLWNHGHAEGAKHSMMIAGKKDRPTCTRR
jgi:phosphatidylserine/phosphatidylglycerophosphate/cardiolipin synthase-like enzyme